MLRHTGLRYEKLLSGHPRDYLFHGEAEALAMFVAARQPGDHANHLDVASLPFVRQCDGETLFGLPCGVIETEAEGEGGEEQGAYKARNQRLRWDQKCGQKARQQQQADCRRFGPTRAGDRPSLAGSSVEGWGT